MRRIEIVADAGVVGLADALPAAFDVRALPPESIDKSALGRADAIVTRTRTRLVEPLLSGTSVRAAFTASAGVDHVDRVALRELGITFGHAPGANARAVCDWTVFALLYGRAIGQVGEGPVGLLGHGQVGSRVAAVLADLGFEVIARDPDVDPATLPQGRCADAETLVRECETLSLHTPLTRPGEHHDPTFHWLARQRLPARSRLRAVLNSARGEIIEPSLIADPNLSFALDVWPSEPALPDAQYFHDRARIWLATPHIAGYSAAAKARCTRAAVEFLCEQFDIEPPAPPAPAVDRPVQSHPATGGLRGEAGNVAHEMERRLGLLACDDDFRKRVQQGHNVDAARRAYGLRPELDPALIKAAAPRLRASFSDRA